MQPIKDPCRLLRRFRGLSCVENSLDKFYFVHTMGSFHCKPSWTNLITPFKGTHIDFPN